MKSNNRRREIIIRYGALALILLLLLFLVLRLRRTWITKQGENVAVTTSGEDTIPYGLTDTLTHPSDTTLRADTAGAPAKDTVESAEDTTGFSTEDQTSATGAGTATTDTSHPEPPPDTAVGDTVSDSLAPQLTPCEADTVPPWVYPDPSGGLHYGGIAVTLKTTERCTVKWKFEGQRAWKMYSDTPVDIASNTTLLYRATDSCGNAGEVRREYYEIKSRHAEGRCPPDMAYIEVGETPFCMDRYEWPNEKGRIPRAFISLYHAMDSCYSVGKRLCTTEEWTLGCAGPGSRRYPYGDAYEPYACVTEDTTVRRSGSRPECRGYFNVFDMSGNLAEWTSTRSSRNPRFYNVMGGLWESGSESGCRHIRYSYYPQNRHNPVGFRCCADPSDTADKPGKAE